MIDTHQIGLGKGHFIHSNDYKYNFHTLHVEYPDHKTEFGTLHLQIRRQEGRNSFNIYISFSRDFIYRKYHRPLKNKPDIRKAIRHIRDSWAGSTVNLFKGHRKRKIYLDSVHGLMDYMFSMCRIGEYNLKTVMQKWINDYEPNYYHILRSIAIVLKNDYVITYWSKPIFTNLAILAEGVPKYGNHKKSYDLENHAFQNRQHLFQGRESIKMAEHKMTYEEFCEITKELSDDECVELISHYKENLSRLPIRKQVYNVLMKTDNRITRRKYSEIS